MKSYKTVDEYISSFPKDVQTSLQQIRETIKKVAPEASEAISYGIPTFKLNGNLVHFAGYNTHFGFYPGSAAIQNFKKELSSYDISKGTIRFPLDKSLPLNLIKKITKSRVKANLSK